MSDLHKVEVGFGSVEFIIILVAIAILSFAGWSAWHANHSSPATTKQVTSTAAGPYTGWNTAELKYEKLQFRYPPQWKLSNDSLTSATDPNNCALPGEDQVSLSAPNSNGEVSVSISAGVACAQAPGGVAQVASEPIKTTGQNYFLSFIGAALPSDDGQPSYACISSSSSAYIEPLSKNIKVNPNSVLNEPMDKSGHTLNGMCFFNHPIETQKTVAQMESDPAFNSAKLIFESMHY